MKLRCLLVDDEPPALDILETYVGLVDALELVGRCENAIQAFQFLKLQPVDLLFLDIKMPQLSGMDLARSLRNPPLIIFTTAFRDYALDSYELDIVDYLLKPIAFDRFLRAVDKAMSRKGAAPAVTSITTQLYQPNQDAFIYVRTDRKSVKVLLREVLYVESLKDYVKIVLTTGKPLLVKQAISNLTDMLPAEQFIRIHRSYLIAIHHVTAYTPQQVELAGQALPVGGLYQKDLLRALENPSE